MRKFDLVFCQNSWKMLRVLGNECNIRCSSGWCTLYTAAECLVMLLWVCRISKELDWVPKYHTLEPTWSRSSVGRTLDLRTKGRGFESNQGQAHFSACPVWMYTQSDVTKHECNIFYLLEMPVFPWINTLPGVSNKITWRQTSHFRSGIFRRKYKAKWTIPLALWHSLRNVLTYSFISFIYW